MREWAVLNSSGTVINIVKTSSRERIQEGYPSPAYSIIPVENVPTHLLERYEYWSGRD